MATTNIESSIQNVTGVAPDALSVSNAQKFVVSNTPKNLLRFAMGVSSASTDGTAIAFEKNDSIIEVQRNGFSCREIPFSESVWATDDGSLRKATAKHPVWWSQNDGVKIAPTTSNSAGAGYVHFIDSSEINDDTDLRNAVVFHAVSQEFSKLARAGLFTWTSPVAPSPPSQPSFGSALSIVSNPPVSPSLSSRSVNTSNWVSPIYTKPIFNTPTLDAMGDLTLPVLPIAPSTGTASITFTHPEPVYIKPVFTPPSLESVGDLVLPPKPIAPDSPSFTYTDASVIDMIKPILDISDMASLSVNAPSYTKPVLGLTTLGNISDLTITSAAPIAPSSPDFTYINADVSEVIEPLIDVRDMASLDADAPSYTAPIAPVFDFSSVSQSLSQMELPSDLVLPNLSIDALPSVSWDVPSAPVSPVLDFSGIDQVIDTIVLPPDVVVPQLSFDTFPTLNFNFPSAPSINPPRFDDLDNWINIEEDPEMGAVRVQSIQSKIQEYNTNVSKFSAETQSIIAANQSEAKSWSDEWGLKLNQYSTEINALVNKYQGESQGKQSITQAQVAARNSQVQEIVSRNQAEVNTYQAKIGAYKSEMDVLVAKNQGQIQEWVNEWNIRTQKYSSELNAVLGKYTAEVQGEQLLSTDKVNIFKAQLNKTTEQFTLELGTYNSNIQSQVNVFNRDSAVYQEDIQRKVENLRKDLQVAVESSQTQLAARKTNVDNKTQLSLQNAINNFQEDVQEYTLSMQKYGNDIQLYSQSVGVEVNEFTSNFQKNLQVFQAENQINLSAYNSDIQNEINVFNKESVIFQEDVQRKAQNFQKDIQEAIGNVQNEINVNSGNLTKEVQLQLQNAVSNYKKDVDEYASELQKYGADTNIYQIDVNSALQKWTADEWGQKFGKYQSDYTNLLQEYQIDVQRELNKFNKELSAYQAQLQISLKEGDYLDSADMKKLQKYQNELASYQANVTADVQSWTSNEWTKKFISYRDDYTVQLKEYATRLQDELNVFNASTISYQAEIQKSLKDADLDAGEDALKLQKYQVEMVEYQHNVAKEVQDYVNTLNKEVQEYQSKLALFTSEIQKFQSEIGEIAQRGAVDTQKVAFYEKESDKYYTWAKNEVMSYIQNNQKMIQQTMAAQVAAQRQG